VAVIALLNRRCGRSRCANFARYRIVVGVIDLRAVAPQIKQAQVGTYAAANATLDQALAAHGLDSGIKRAQANDQQIALGNVAAQLAQDPEIYNAVLSIKSAEASQIAEQLAAAK
jgi:hypothetical protein